jgi:hypothetical protein
MGSPDFLCLEGELRFRLKPGVTIDSLPPAFSTFFERASRWTRLLQQRRYFTDILSPGTAGIVIFHRRWRTGEAGALLLFFAEGRGRGRVAVLGFIPYATARGKVHFSWQTERIREGDLARLRPVAEKLRDEALAPFFKQACRRLIQLEDPLTVLDGAVTDLDDEGESPEDAKTSLQTSTPTTTARDQHTIRPPPIRFCPNCDAVTAIGEAGYCWNCGAQLGGEARVAAKTDAETSLMPLSRNTAHIFEHVCMICAFAFRNEEPILSCPHCGALAHRIEMLEWLHVKGLCPACGRHLTSEEVGELLTD